MVVVGADTDVFSSLSHTGVIPEGRRWHVRIFFKNYTTHLGTFDTEEEAARAYDAEARRIWENAICNFHRNGSLNPNRNSREGARTMVPRPGVEPLNGEKRKEREQEKKASTFRGAILNHLLHCCLRIGWPCDEDQRPIDPINRSLLFSRQASHTTASSGARRSSSRTSSTAWGALRRRRRRPGRTTPPPCSSSRTPS